MKIGLAIGEALSLSSYCLQFSLETNLKLSLLISIPQMDVGVHSEV